MLYHLLENRIITTNNYIKSPPNQHVIPLFPPTIALFIF